MVRYETFLELILPLPKSTQNTRRKQPMIENTNEAFQKSQEIIQQLRQGRERIDKKIEQPKRVIERVEPRVTSSRPLRENRIYHTPKKRNYGDMPSSKRSTPLKGNEEHHLVQALHEMIIINNDIEDIKKQLSLRIDFHPSTVYSMIDRNDRNQLNKLDFELACNGTIYFI